MQQEVRDQRRKDLVGGKAGPNPRQPHDLLVADKILGKVVVLEKPDIDPAIDDPWLIVDPATVEGQQHKGQATQQHQLKRWMANEARPS